MSPLLRALFGLALVLPAVIASGSQMKPRKKVVVPKKIWNLGLELFKSEHRLKGVLRQTAAPKLANLTFDGNNHMTMMLVRDRGHFWKDLVLDTQADEYQIQRLHSPGPKFMVDIGANIGTQSIFAMKVQPEARVLAFEPVPSAYFYFVWNLHLNGIPILTESDLSDPSKHGVVPLHKAVSKDGKDVMMDWPSDAGTELATMKGHRADSDQLSIPSVKLPDLLPSLGAGRVDLMKIDCEGCEYDIVPDLKNLICDRKIVHRMSGELHHDASLHPDMMNFFSNNEVDTTMKVLHDCGCAADSRWMDCGRLSHRDPLAGVSGEIV